ncbi:MAG: hypothetical protein ACRCT8_04390 [Lacipirellulaceae bacterium]
MKSLNYRELKRRYDLDGPARTTEHLTEALAEGTLKAEDFSLRDLAEALVPDGREWVRTLDPRSGGDPLTEQEGVDASAFRTVAAQVVQSKVLEAYTNEAFVVSRMVSTIPTRLDGEKIPGATRVADQIDEVGAGMPYPSLGFDEDYIETPSTTKRGFIVPVTREAIFFDRTNLVLSRAAEVGEVLGHNKEKRLLDLVLGITNNFKHRGVASNTYLASGAWVNVVTANELVDWTDVDAAEQRLAEIVDPATGEPVVLRGTQVLVMPAYRHAAQRVFSAAQISYEGGTAATTTYAANPLRGYEVAESRLAFRRVLATGVSADAAKKWWFLGDFRKAFAYMENWPITVTQAPLGSEADFTSDVVLRFKASERGAAAVLNPRCVVKCTG